MMAGNGTALNIGSTEIDNTFAEAFSMKFTRLIVTAIDRHWLDAALRELCGYGTSVIGCDAEVGIECYLPPERTIDGRPGAAVMVFAFSTAALGTALVNRVGQSVMTCPTSAVFDGLSNAEQSLPLGRHLRFFGDGFQKSKLIDGYRYWRIPVMDGEFVVQDTAGVASGVAGGNFLIQSADQASGLAAARRAVDAIQQLPGVVTPFPGGVVRSGSKVGSKYKRLKASTAESFCPTLRGRADSKIHPRANCIYEIVIDGENYEAVGNAMRVGIRAAVDDRIVAISAGNYGGKLGKYRYPLHEILV
jgi:formylmethanofuran--tetrahydromethanopterin N-formyltransferase